MSKLWNVLSAIFAAIGLWLGLFIGPVNGLLIALIVFVITDYITGLASAIVRKELSSSVGFKGLARKVLIFLIVGIANVLDVYVLGANAVLRTAVILFYMANEGLSIIENAGEIGLPIPKKLRDVLAQL
ncbi:MAG: phage holin family protein, partial [Kiritimatiellae bacterium]|nr:phage holin family protein [Kiritimatiellia bacterium]